MKGENIAEDINADYDIDYKIIQVKVLMVLFIKEKTKKLENQLQLKNQNLIMKINLKYKMK